MCSVVCREHSARHTVDVVRAELYECFYGGQKNDSNGKLLLRKSLVLHYVIILVMIIGVIWISFRHREYDAFIYVKREMLLIFILFYI